MAASEYYQKQIELLLLWALATTDRDVKLKLLARMLDLILRANITGEETMRALQEALGDVVQQYDPSRAHHRVQPSD